jgi:hypothetical protein
MRSRSIERAEEENERKRENQPATRIKILIFLVAALGSSSRVVALVGPVNRRTPKSSMRPMALGNGNFIFESAIITYLALQGPRMTSS